MRQGWRLTIMGVAGLLGLFGTVSSAPAVEYRLQVVSMWETGFASFLKGGELRDGAAGPGLDRLEAALDAGQVPRGPFLVDRTPQAASETVARAWGAARVRAEVKAGEGKQIWDEVRWDGQPGERSLWVVSASGPRRPEELYRIALKGTGPLRNFQPYAPVNGTRLHALRFPLNLLWAEEERGTIWDKYLSRSLDLSEGIAAVVGDNTNRTMVDQMYLVVSQGAQPATYKAVLAWRQRNNFDQLEGLGKPGQRFP